MPTSDKQYKPLNSLEAQAVLEKAHHWNTAMSRGRAVFNCSVTDAGKSATGNFHQSPPPECDRIEFAWEGKNSWQAIAYDHQGTVLSDIASDGQWVDTGEKRWSYLYEDDTQDDCDESENEVVDEDPNSPRALSRRAYLELAWAKKFAENFLNRRHLLSISNHPWAIDMGFPPVLFRNADTETIQYRMQTISSPIAFSDGLWGWICWQFTKLTSGLNHSWGNLM